MTEVSYRVVEACAMMLPPIGLVLSLAKLIPSGFATTWLVRTTATPNSSAIRVSCRRNLRSGNEICNHNTVVIRLSPAATAVLESWGCGAAVADLGERRSIILETNRSALFLHTPLFRSLAASLFRLQGVPVISCCWQHRQRCEPTKRNRTSGAES